MKELLLQYAAYNIWANNKMIEALRALPGEALDMPLLSSFKSIRETVYHMWSAEDGWLQRLVQADEIIWMAAIFKGDLDEALNNWQAVSHDLLEYVQNLDGTTILEELHYEDSRKNKHITPVYQVMQHVFNHATYHRGQLVTMMRTAGESKMPGTDFIGFVREQK